MKIHLYFLFCVGCVFIGNKQVQAKNLNTSGQLFFIENKGQVTDQYGHARNDIQYALQSNGISIFIGNGQMHYQFSHLSGNGQCTPEDSYDDKNTGIPAMARPHATITYRMDVELAGANKYVEGLREECLDYYERYYVPGCPAEGLQAHTCSKITYKNIYPGIDWVLFISGDKLEHEFVVGPGADASQIRLRYSGQSSLQINDDGSITATTPMGVIKEHAPVCYTPGGVLIQSAYRLAGNELSYDIPGITGALVIDPVVEWGTYYGFDSSTSPFYGVACDKAACVYGCGLTYSTSSIATTGSFQDTLIASPDAYLVKFDSSGNRKWGTYYGGINGNWGTGVACDNWGYVYLDGTTQSPANIATPGCQQPTFGGGEWDGFLAKFDSLGVRKWATYVGGSGSDIPSSVACDTLGHVYVSGFTGSPNNIATPGGFMPAEPSGEDVCLIQYDTAGVRKWGTYYGGSANTFGGVSCTDGRNVYLTAWTASATGISSPGCYQPALNGPADAFLVKFDVSGARQWATYYGGESTEQTGGITCDLLGGMYLFGTTYSNTGMATPGCFQPVRGGGADAFLARFDEATGTPVWSTYYGGPADEITTLSRIVSDESIVLITGITSSLTGIASAGAWQTTYGGGDDDAFLAAYETSGAQVWSTYLGGTGIDEARACATDGLGGGIYVCGQTTSTTNIATPGGFLPTGGGGGTGYDYQGFMVKFFNPLPPDVLSAAATIPRQGTISIFPIPNNGSFSLTGIVPQADGTVQITITDVTGRVVLRDEVGIVNGIIRREISLGDVPGGVYVLTAVSKEQVNVLKFVKE